MGDKGGEEEAGEEEEEEWKGKRGHRRGRGEEDTKEGGNCRPPASPPHVWLTSWQSARGA